jgi:hypothetical protein
MPAIASADFCLYRIHHPTGQAHFHRLGLADSAGEPLRSAHSGCDSKLDLGLAKFRIIRSNNEIGHHRQLAPAAEREAGDGRNPGLAGRGDLFVAVEIVAAIHICKGLALHLLDVSACRKGLFGTGQDCATLAVIGVECSECGNQILQHLRIECVQRLWAVERDQGHPAPLVNEDGFIARAFSRHSGFHS